MSLANARDTRDTSSIPGSRRFLCSRKWQPTPILCFGITPKNCSLRDLGVLPSCQTRINPILESGQFLSLPRKHQREASEVASIPILYPPEKCVLAAQFCLTLCDAMDCSPPYFSVHGISQASLSMGFPRQEFWSGLSLPYPGDLPDPGIKPRSPAVQADSLPLWLKTKNDMWKVFSRLQCTFLHLCRNPMKKT